MTFAQAIATMCWIGHIRPAPGTWGSLAALPLAWLCHFLGGPLLLLFGIFLFFTIGLWATSEVTRSADDHDPSEVVIDELVGQWIALLPVSFGASLSGVDILALWPGWIAAFLLFRMFDILKPGPVGWADQRKDALGVMLDDALAGVLAAIGVILIAAVSHGVFVA